MWRKSACWADGVTAPEIIVASDPALSLRPADADAVLGYGLCLKRLGRLSEAKEVLSRAKELQFQQVKANQAQRNSEEKK